MNNSAESKPYMNAHFATPEAHPGSGGNVVIFSEDPENMTGGMLMETGRKYKIQFSKPYVLGVELESGFFAPITQVSGLFEIFRPTNIRVDDSTWPPQPESFTLVSDITGIERPTKLQKPGSLSRNQLEHLSIPVLTAAVITVLDNERKKRTINKPVFELKFRQSDSVQESK